MSLETDYKQHWESVFQTKDTSKVSWFQDTPKLSLELIQEHTLSKSDAIIDIGGGDSRLPDGLLELGYKDISVLDISKQALSVSQARLGPNATNITWLVNNVLEMNTTQNYDLWHDRAVFHFISNKNDQLKYKEQLSSSLSKDGKAIIGAFSNNDGPKVCSGLETTQQDRDSIKAIFYPEFEIVKDFEAKHETPSGLSQNFYWVVIKKKNKI